MDPYAVWAKRAHTQSDYAPLRARARKRKHARESELVDNRVCICILQACQLAAVQSTAASTSAETATADSRLPTAGDKLRCVAVRTFTYFGQLRWFQLYFRVLFLCRLCVVAACCFVLVLKIIKCAIFRQQREREREIGSRREPYIHFLWATYLIDRLWADYLHVCVWECVSEWMSLN